MSTSLIKPTFNKPLSLSETCLFSLPWSIFNPKTSHQCLSTPTKPIKLHFSTLKSLPFPLKPKPHFPLLTLFVAQTSDWAQQEEEEEEEKENNPIMTLEQEEELEAPTWGSEGVSDTEARVSDWEPEEEEGTIKGESFGEEEGGEGGFVEPPEEAKLFVGNLPYDVDSQKLAMLFEQAGTVEIAEVIYNRQTDTSRGFGFVTMSTIEEAEKAVDMFHQYDMEGRLLTVNKAAPRGVRAERPPRVNEPGYRIYVGNLPWNVDNSRLEQVFSEHGKVVEARVVYDRESGRSRGFGFVTVSTEMEMNDAIAALDGQILDGRAIRVSVAEERPRRNF